MTVEVVVAPNPGLMTGPGTNTWVVFSEGECAIVDPGPVIDEHLDRVRKVVEGSRPVAVLVTHSHPDHAPAANPLASELDVVVMGRSAGPAFSPDRLVVEGDEIRVGVSTFLVIATPGHTDDSTSYRLGNALFTGDHIMGGSTVVVEDMAAYMASLERLHGTGLTRLYPGHGPVIDSPDATISDYLEHRRGREAAILKAVSAGAAAVGEVVETVYRDVDPRLHDMAAISVAAHLRKLAADGRVRFDESVGRVTVGIDR